MTVAGFDRITIDPQQMNGQPCVRDLRLTVQRVLEIISRYPDRAELFRDFPELQDDDLKQVLEFAAANLADETLDIRVA